MRLLIYSDLHLETNAFVPPSAACDVVVLAGDIHEGTAGVAWARAQFAGTPVVYVPGNHEYYGHVAPDLAGELLAAAAGSNVHVLDRAGWTWRGVRFLGCTLWSDFRLLDDRARSAAEALARGTDYRAIRADSGARAFRPADAMAEHARARDWLAAELEEPWPGPTVIVTHHAPSAVSVPDHYLTRMRAAAYASDLDDLVASSGAVVWIHGHVHSRCDYAIGDTRVIANPRGVGDESVGAFDPAFTVEV